ncbi:MAG: hypothetical protein Q7J80_16565, partial [Anaerolineales bacterium]|nr:hypothetical protein [Anaerolineales bacterium]
MPTIAPSATLEPGPFIFDIAPYVPSKDEAEIKLGIDLVRSYLRDFIGGDISSNFKQFVIKIVADGKGNDGSCCTGLAESGPRPFFDVKHLNWNIGSSDYWSNTDNHMNAGAHEYVHAWQSSLGCLTIHYQPLGNWLNEGMAQYVSINALRRGGHVTEQDYQDLLSVALAKTRFENLAFFEQNNTQALDDIAFIAVVRLISLAPDRELSLRVLCENVASGKSVEQSFTDAFGISKKDYYNVFAEYQKTYSTPTPTAPPVGAVAVRGTVILASPSQKFSDYYVVFCNLEIAQCLPVNLISEEVLFVAYLEPGDYKMSVNP